LSPHVAMGLGACLVLACLLAQRRMVEAGEALRGSEVLVAEAGVIGLVVG